MVCYICQMFMRNFLQKSFLLTQRIKNKDNTILKYVKLDVQPMLIFINL